MRKNFNNNGKAFEAIIESINLQYQRQGLMRLKKVDPPTRIIRGQVLFLENPFLDYAGVCTVENGRAVFVEAKSTSYPRLPIGGHGGLSDKQIAALDMWETAGALVGVLWFHEEEMRFVTRSMAHDVLASPAASLKWTAAEVIPKGHGFVIHDYLVNLRAHARRFAANAIDAKKHCHKENAMA